MQTSFNKGLWSPKLQNRFEVEQYRSACSELDNFTILPQGGIARRNGTVFLLECYDSTHKSILIPFQLDKDTQFIVELSGNEKMRILQYNSATGALTVKQDNITTGFTDAKLDEVNWIQVNKKLYITHKSHAPRKLSRITDTTWLWTEIVPYPAAQRMNRYDFTGTLGLAAASGNDINFTCGDGILLHGDVGKFLVADPVDGKAGYAIITAYTTATTGICSIIEPFNDIALAAGEWYAQGNGGGKQDIQYYGPEGRKCTLTTDAIVGGNDFFRPADVNRYMEINEGFVRIVKYVATNQVEVVIIKVLADEVGTYDWTMSRPEWGGLYTYPKTIAFYENRLFYGGTIEKTGNVWGSRSQFYNDFTAHADDEYALQYLLSGATLHEILWMVGAQVLVIGTTNGIWTIGRADTSAVLTPTTPMLGYQSTISCAGIRPATIGNIIFFAQRNRKILRSFEASSGITTEKAVPTDETLFADPFTGSNISQLIAQSNPYIVLWATNVVGDLWGLNYIQEQQINSWFKFTTDGFFESTMVYPQENTDDLLFTTTKRTIDSVTKRYIECFYSTSGTDSMKIFTAVADDTTTLTGYTHLKAKEVWVYTEMDGWLRNADETIHCFTVSAAGNIDIDDPLWTPLADTKKAWAGLPYTAEAKTMNWYGGPNDFSYEKLRRLSKLQVTVLDAVNGEVGIQVEEDTAPTYVKLIDAIPASAYTGILEKGVNPGTGRIMKLCIRQTQPDALIVTGLGCNLK
jgi:hypothetical protein